MVQIEGRSAMNPRDQRVDDVEIPPSSPPALLQHRQPLPMERGKYAGVDADFNSGCLQVVQDLVDPVSLARSVKAEDKDHHCLDQEPVL